MSADLGLDSSDPLDMLLHPESTTDDSPESSTDWSKFSTLWADNSDQLKQYGDMMDFSDMAGLSMDMEFNPAMTIEPNMLSYDAMKFNNFTFDEQFSNEFLASSFPFAFQPNASGDLSSSSDSASPPRQRRDSVTSSSSSSGASLSPVPESVPSPQSGYISDTVQPKEEPCLDPVAELAQQVRMRAGVMLAVPMNAHLQGADVQIPGMNGTGKLPIPRLPRANPTSSPQPSVSSSAASTPPPSTPPSGFKPSAPLQMAASTSSVIGDATSYLAAAASSSNLPRPKTSHTTIERRYRTNLNARIQSLRMAVPALRVLEDREGGNGKKIKKNVKTTVIVKGSGADVDIDESAGVDVIDERGFVDGVKVARKCSKANVLGKAVEYIRVLKKREQRLKAEQAGLKTLVSGLVGGPALVREWEKMWREKFGGEEKDEVEGEDEEGDDEDSEDDDGEEGDEDGRKRKRAKVATAAAPKKPVEKEKKPPAPPAVTTDAAGNIVPEKRKRGRPRKVVPPPALTTPVAPPADAASVDFAQMAAANPQWSQQPAQPQQFLLAVFALFSFFNSPLTASSPLTHAHHHTGTVLTVTPLAYAPELVPNVPVVHPAAGAAASWALKEYLQMYHLAVSVLVLLGLVGNWFGFSLSTYLEKSFARNQQIVSRKPARAGPTDWVQRGQESVLEEQTSSLSLYERYKMYRSISSKVHLTVTDLATLALVIRGTRGILEGPARSMAASMWSSATRKAHPKHPLKMSEQLIFDTLDIDEAVAYLARAGPLERADEEKAYTPLQVLGAMVVKERIKSHLGSMFVDGVDAQQAEARGRDSASSNKEDEEPAWRQTIDAARELGGHIEDLGKMLERVWKAESGVSADEVLGLAVVMGELADSDSNSDVDSAATKSDIDTDIEALLAALVLYREVFPRAPEDDWLSSSTSTLLSPPPTPTSKASLKRGIMLRSLRTVLGNRVFESGDVPAVVEQSTQGEEEVTKRSLGLEDARDLVVDMIFDAERPLRAQVSS